MQRIHGTLGSSIWGFSRGVSFGCSNHHRLKVAELVPNQQMGYVAYRRPDLDAGPTRAVTLRLVMSLGDSCIFG